MLVEFSVQNFRSIAERQKLSMVAGASAARRHQHSMESGNSFAPRLLRSACLFGPNGSGKTSVVRAIAFFANFVISSAKDYTEGENINVSPFRLDKAMVAEPSEFEAVFITQGAMYQYGFSVDRERVRSEWLFSKPSEPGTRMRILFQREYDPDKDTYEWLINEAYVKGERETWKAATRANALFLSTAIQLNSDSLRVPFDWIQDYLRVISSPERLHYETSAKRASQPDMKHSILQFVRSAGLPISDIHIEEKDLAIPKEWEEMFQETVLERIRKSNRNLRDYSVQLVHRNAAGISAEFDWSEESDGTRVLFSLAGPWIEVLQEGYTLVIDELHNSLHPMALRHLVEMFHDPELNKNGAQIIFTSHDTSVIAKDFMHRDQIWLLEKDNNEATQLTPLSDFKVREVDAFQKAYLNGKFGALPKIGSITVGE